MVAELGGEIGRVLVVGCQPADLDEGIGLSPPVAAAVDDRRADGRRAHRREERTMLRRLVLLVGLVGAAVAVAREIAPEVRRYLKLREM